MHHLAVRRELHAEWNPKMRHKKEGNCNLHAQVVKINIQHSAGSDHAFLGAGAFLVAAPTVTVFSAFLSAAAFLARFGCRYVDPQYLAVLLARDYALRWKTKLAQTSTYQIYAPWRT